MSKCVLLYLLDWWQKPGKHQTATVRQQFQNQCSDLKYYADYIKHFICKFHDFTFLF